jgi:hypothetical protein
MKLKALFIALVITMTSTAFAQFFPAKAYVTVLPGQVTAQVYNPYYEPIICSGQVFGQTAYGAVYNAFFAQQFLPAGGYRFATVNTNGFNPFVTGWANIHCRFAGFW